MTIGAGAVSVSGANTGDQTSVSGNAGTATALQNARTIGGVSFDGTANIVPTTITVADTADTTCWVGLWTDATGDLLPKSDGGLTYNASTAALTATTFVGALTGNASGSAATVTSATQSAITTCANLVTIGTITSGGLGTGAVIAKPTMTLGSDADGDIYYRASNVLTRLAKGTAGQVLAMNSGATAPSWTVTALTSAIATPLSGQLAQATASLAVNTTATVYTFNIIAAISVVKCTTYWSASAVNGTYDVVVYSEDGQSQLISYTTGTITGAQIDTVSITPVFLNPGRYYALIVPNSTASNTVRTWDTYANLDTGVPTGEAVWGGTLTVTASTPPATIDPTAIVAAADLAFLLRFDT